MKSENAKRIKLIGIGLLVAFFSFLFTIFISFAWSLPVSLNLYIKIYVFLVLFYLWYRFILLFVSDLKKRKYIQAFDVPVSVIIPAYNEDNNILRNCVESVVNVKGEKEIILVNDGSKPDKKRFMEKLAEEYNLKLISYDVNQGKRYAQIKGVEVATHPIVVTMDSDTVLIYDSIKEITKPFKDPKVGAVTGQILVSNKDVNIWTKMVNARYWSAFNVERKGLSAFAVVNCCSGPFSAYRREALNELSEIYLNQEFMGEMCTYGDDRHLTNLFLEYGYKVVYQESAMAYTESPTNLKTLVKQQLRWKRSFIRESLYALTYSFNRSKLLFFDTLFNLCLPFFAIVSRFMVIIFLVLFPKTIFLFIGSVVLVSFIRNFTLFMNDWKSATYSVYYAFVHEFVIYWLFFVALFTLKKRGWSTR